MNERDMAAAGRIAELQAEVKRLKSDKRELVKALEYAIRFVVDADMDYIEAAILKHKEGL
jgi:hypothetical protein